MSKKKDGPFALKGAKIGQFVYRSPKHSPEARNATLGVKFAQRRVILDDYWLFGGTRWDRTKHRLKHPIIYSKRGLKGLYRRIKRLFVKERSVQCLWLREWIGKEEAKKIWPEKKRGRHRAL